MFIKVKNTIINVSAISSIDAKDNYIVVNYMPIFGGPVKPSWHELDNREEAEQELEYIRQQLEGLKCLAQVKPTKHITYKVTLTTNK